MGLSKEEICKHVGNRIREIRVEKGLTIETLSHQSGIDYTQISRIELGKINTSIYQIYTICEFLEIPVYELFKSISVK
jgi:transcriptional regulator with XRE-family HTH domain